MVNDQHSFTTTKRNSNIDYVARARAIKIFLVARLIFLNSLPQRAILKKALKGPMRFHSFFAQNRNSEQTNECGSNNAFFT